MSPVHLRSKFIWLLSTVFAVPLLLTMEADYLTPSLAQNEPAVQMMIPVEGNLSDASAQQDWRLSLSTEREITVLVDRLDGDLDPTVAVLDSSGEMLAENDDRLENLVFDAGLEHLALESGDYVIRVGRFGGAGNYRLWVIPGYGRVWEMEDFEDNGSRWANRYAEQTAGRLVMGFADPRFSILNTNEGGVVLNDFYVQSQVKWLSSPTDVDATIGFVLRAQDDDVRLPAGYYFLVYPDGTWAVEIRQGESVNEMLPRVAHPKLAQRSFTLGAWLEGDQLRFYADGELLGEVEDITFAAGLWGWHLRGETAGVSMAVDQLLLTVPQTERSPVPQQIESWRDADFNNILLELQREDVVSEAGQMAFVIASQNYMVRAGEETVYPQHSADEQFSDIVAGVDVGFIEGNNIACGLGVRYLDSSNKVLAYVDVDNGAGLVYTRDGVLERNTYDFLSETPEPLPLDRRRLLLIAQGDLVHFYVDGTWFATEYIPPVLGDTDVVFLNYSTSAASCIFENLWVWQIAE
jgi:hypothetical protein